MPSPRHAAFDIAGHAGSAHLGAHRVNHATGRNSDPARQRRTAVAIAAHPRLPFVDVVFRNEIERVVVFGREARPVLRIRTTSTARLARAFQRDVWVGCWHAGSFSAERRDRPVRVGDSGVARMFPNKAPSPFRPEQVAPFRIFLVEIDGVDDPVGSKAAKIPAQFTPSRQ
jgi:hypothetical protein